MLVTLLTGLVFLTWSFLARIWKQRKRHRLNSILQRLDSLEHPYPEVRPETTLLRASSEPLHPETLLRPAPAAPIEETNQLLRPKRDDSGE
ncbi:MAG: hypothetical protein NT023_09665 [Armatimonadetes bacterium]|nr:hypothetical protein [Armatimonadota bacterium]